MTDELEITLATKYPNLFKNYKGDPKRTCMAWGIECCDGWYKILDHLFGYLTNLMERKLVIETLKPVDWAVVAIDKDNRQVDKSIKMIYELYKDEFENFIFSNGGDQTEFTIAEGKICNELGIKMVFGLGDKIQSSSWLLNKI